MFKITKIGYDINTLQYDLGPGSVIKSKDLKDGFKKLSFKSIGGALKFACKKLGISYRKYDWNFEQDLDCNGNDGWVLHIIVEDKTMKYATEKMIDSWKKNDGKPKLVDLLANVFIEKE